MNGLVTATTGLGNANFPAIWPTGFVIPSGYRLRLTITDLSGAPNTIFFTIAGRKIYAPFKQVREVLADTQVAPSVPTPADSAAQLVPAPLV
jgi:hypothetical protein